MNYVQLQDRATECFQNYQYSDSIAFYEQCIEINPKEVSNYWYLGIASLLAGEELLTETVWMSVLSQASEEEADFWTNDLVKIIERVATQCLKSKRLPEAQKLYLKIQQIIPNYANAYLGLGFVHIENSEFNKAINSIKKFIELKSDFAPSYYHLGCCFQQLEQHQEAIYNFQQAIAIKNDYLDAYYNLGVCLKEAKEYKLAIERFRFVINLFPNHLSAYVYLGDCLLKTQQFDAAIEYFNKALEIQPQLPIALCGLGACWTAKGELEKAQTLLEQALELAPNNPVAYFNLASCFRKLGQLDKTINYLNKAIKFRPDWLDVEKLAKKLQEPFTYCPKIHQGYNIWDGMLFKHEDCYRLLYLQGNSRACPFWSVGEMAMAISTDLKHWQYQGVVLETDPESNWSDGRILAGSLYKENGIYYLFYSAASSQDILEEKIGLATSVDGITWKKRKKPFLQQDKRFYGSYPSVFNEKPGKQTPWRDPYLVKDPDTGKYYMFITTSFQGDDTFYKGCIGLAVADRIDGDYEILPPVVLPLVEGTQESIFGEMERPQVIYKNGQYHLFCSATVKNINPRWLEQVGKDGITNFSLYWYVSDKITGPFEPISEKPVVKGSEYTGLYATNIIEAPNGTLFATGSEGMSKTLELSSRYPVIWEDDRLEIIVDRKS
ncbi:MAG: hypothetical protein Tsb0014_02850 [Pleurocapsa sp.]